MCDQWYNRKLCAHCHDPYIVTMGQFVSCPKRLRGEPCGPFNIVYNDTVAGTSGGKSGLCGDCVLQWQAEVRARYG